MRAHPPHFYRAGGRCKGGKGRRGRQRKGESHLAVGLLLGFDVLNVILLLNTQKAVESFYSVAKVSFGAETLIAMELMGSSTSIESSVERAPIQSYVKSRGLYAGIEVMGQAFLSRFDENER